MNYLSNIKEKNQIEVFHNSKFLPIICNENDGVKYCVNHLIYDIERVSGVKTEVVSNIEYPAEASIIIGTIGESVIIDNLISSKEIDENFLKGKWDAFLIQTVENNIVIAGSNKRGTIYGIYDFCKKLGVSPLHWLADVPVKKKSSIYMTPGVYYSGEPKVKYRGFFINDEYPCLGRLAKEKFGGFTSLFYKHIFELLLRLKGNYLWPAMWNDCFFDDDPENNNLADMLGIIVGTSHHEPMMRSWKEWDRYGVGEWHFQKNRDVLTDFWTNSLKRVKLKNCLVTIGMRGDGDEAQEDYKQKNNLLETIKIQRDIIKTVTGKEPEDIPQIWAVYKEIQELYDEGFRVPEDVITLLCDDNWGNLRRIPEKEDLTRPGGFGLYYHFDYVGGPRNYKWINTSPIPRVWEQLNLAYKNGIDKLWIVNVGDIKPLEFPMNFFMDYAWNPEELSHLDLETYTEKWAEEQFSSEYSREIADIISLYSKLNGRIKPELLDHNTYSLVNFKESEVVNNQYKKLVERVYDIKKRVQKEYMEPFFELVEYPVRASANLHALYRNTALNRLYKKQNRNITNVVAKKVQECFEYDKSLTKEYHDLLNGKWNYIASQTHIGYTSWQQPEKDLIPETYLIDIPEKAAMAVAVEMSEESWRDKSVITTFPVLYRYGKSESYFEIYNMGRESFDYNLEITGNFIEVNKRSGTVYNQERVFVSIDWDKLEDTIEPGRIKVYGSYGSVISINLTAINQSLPDDLPKDTYIEADGYIVIDPIHFTDNFSNDLYKWNIIPNLGNYNSSLVILPATDPIKEFNPDSIFTEYQIFTANSDFYNVEIHIAPVNAFISDKELKLGLSIDHNEITTLSIHRDYNWNEAVSNNIWKLKTSIKLDKKGFHRLRLHAVNIGIVVEKIVIYKSNLPYSYLGPKESYLWK